MAREKLKHSILTKGKSYSYMDSPFYKLRSKKKLAAILTVDLKDLFLFVKDDGNYRVFLINNDSKKSRLVEQPSDGLNVVHSRIASLLCRITSPDYMHSGVKGKSYLTNAQAHVGVKKILSTDLKSFFTSTSKEMVFSLFRGLFKCSVDVADILANICTYKNHIPTGSRISMPLALWSNISMFQELDLLAKKHEVTMTVYVDDITFSGNAISKHFQSVVKKIITRHGHTMHPTKTAIYGTNDVKVITGVVINRDNVFIKNSQHMKIYQDMILWNQLKNLTYVPDSLKLRLLGRLNALSIVEPRLKDKAKSIQHYKPKT